MLIYANEILALVPLDRAAEIIAALDLDRATQTYEPIFGGKRFRPAVEKALAAMTAND